MKQSDNKLDDKKIIIAKSEVPKKIYLIYLVLPNKKYIAVKYLNGGLVLEKTCEIDEGVELFFEEFMDKCKNVLIKGIFGRFSQSGGLATKKKYGVEFYKKISKLGVRKRKEIAKL